MSSQPPPPSSGETTPTKATEAVDQPTSTPMNPHDRSASTTSVDTVTSPTQATPSRLQPQRPTQIQLPPSPSGARSAASPARPTPSALGRGRAPSQATTNRDSVAYSAGHSQDASSYSNGAPLSPSVAGPGSLRQSSHAYTGSGQSQATNLSAASSQRRATNPPPSARRGSKAGAALPKAEAGRPKGQRALSASRPRNAEPRGKGKGKGFDSDSDDGATSSTQSQTGRLAQSALTDADDSDEELDTSYAFGRAPDKVRVEDEPDDEVARIDRGEELVRRRMRERKREKKEAERRERKRREEEARRERQRQRDFGSLSSSVGAPPSQADFDQNRRSFSASRETGVPYSDDGRNPPLSPILIPKTAPSFRDSQQIPQSQPRAVSYASSVFSSKGGPVTPTAANPDGGEVTEQDDALGEDTETRTETGVDPRDDASVRAEEEEEHDLENIEEAVTPEEDEDEDDDDVEYTLKDRQDAINAEHPFGLPIWKPALYKKSRSVTRNAETALHLQPSLAAERHLLPGNILWTLLFGWWLALICALCSAFLMVVPWGGAKYSRVIWELAGYIFWPFGKYVARIQDEHDDEEEADEGEARDDDEGSQFDVEGAGKTWGRNSAASKSVRGGTQKAAWASYRTGSNVGDGGYGATGTTRDNEDGATTPTPSKPLNGRAGDDADDDEYQATIRQNSRPAIVGSSSSSGERSPLLRKQRGTSGLDSDDGTQDDPHGSGARRFRVRALGRLMYWTVFYLFVAPLMGFVCLICWGGVFTIPMAKLLWVLIRHLADEPLALYFRSPRVSADGDVDVLKAGQQAPPQSKRTMAAMKAAGRIVGSEQKILLCTYKAVGLQYYKYTIDGVNIMFINLLPLVFFVIIDFFFIEPFVEHHHIGGFLGFLGAQATIFTLALLSVIPLSYFIGTAVASISAQSSIGMGAVINATFGSIIEILLYAIALTQRKGKLVEGSIIGSLLAGVLLMPGMSMIGGATRRKEQKFNARSAGVTSTMLIMAIIGVLTPTLFYEIYGTFQLTCNDCPADAQVWQCKHCYYEHVDPTEDPFYNRSVKYLAYYCAVILVVSYLVGLWFSLRTHASQIWQNAAPPPVAELPTISAVTPADINRQSMYKRLPTQVLNILPGHRQSQSGAVRPSSTATNTPLPILHSSENTNQPVDALRLPSVLTAEDLQRVVDFQRVVEAVNSANANAVAPGQPSAVVASQLRQAPATVAQDRPRTLHRQVSRMSQIAHGREPSGKEAAHDDGGGGQGGHDAPNWSRFKSASVLLGCTVLYAIIAEVLVDEIDVVLQGSGIPEKFLGVTLFALVPNTTEFMNAILFARNGNIALSMEIGSAYALQVCLLQIPAMVAFSAFYAVGQENITNAVFTLIFPRWDVIATIFSVFLLTYTYIEARSNYFRGSLLCFSYLVLLGGFYWAPNGGDDSDNPMVTVLRGSSGKALDLSTRAQAAFYSLFAK